MYNLDQLKNPYIIERPSEMTVNYSFVCLKVTTIRHYVLRVLSDKIYPDHKNSN